MIDGSLAGDADGLTIANSTGTLVRGIVISGFDSPGRAGVRFSGASTQSNAVECSNIGTDRTGHSADPNYYGVRFSAPGTLNNQTVISGNLSDGVLFDTGSGTPRATGIYIGTVLSGTGATRKRRQRRSLGRQDERFARQCLASIIAGNAQNGIQVAGLFDVPPTTSGPTTTPPWRAKRPGGGRGLGHVEHDLRAT